MKAAPVLKACFLFQSPPKGATIPYRPKPQVGGPVILAGGQAYTIQGNYAVPAHTDVSSSAVMTPLFPPMPLGHPLPAAAPFVPFEPLKNGQLQAAALPPAHLLPDVSWSYWWSPLSFLDMILQYASVGYLLLMLLRFLCSHCLYSFRVVESVVVCMAVLISSVSPSSVITSPFLASAWYRNDWPLFCV